nr:7TM GPCR domain containing protein [Haemonchus contortus]
MSQRTRQLHSQLLQALAIQTCLPVLYLVAETVQAIDFLNIYHHPLMEYSISYLVVPIPALNPLVSLYFIGPYRNAVERHTGAEPIEDKLVCSRKASISEDWTIQIDPLRVDRDPDDP